jgi:hypothetical protein
VGAYEEGFVSQDDFGHKIWDALPYSGRAYRGMPYFQEISTPFDFWCIRKALSGKI